jgi:plastocyanin
MIRYRLIALALACCATTSVAAQGVAQAPAHAKPDTTVVMKSSGSALEFLPASLSLKTGLKVRVRYTNEGSLPHNIVFVKDAADLDELSTEAYGAAETGFVPVDLKAKLIAWSTLVSPNQTVDVDLVVPAPGEYTFLCLFPGHSGMMFGTLRALR